jgi:hypothetical protein
MTNIIEPDQKMERNENGKTSFIEVPPGVKYRRLRCYYDRMSDATETRSVEEGDVLGAQPNYA